MNFNHGFNQAGCCRPALSNETVNCKNFGPFNAIDAACIVPPRNTGSIIPFSSGIVPASLVTLATGLVSTTSAIGFGTSVPGITIVGNTITLGGTLPSEAFTVPRDGSITALSATFVATAAVAALTGATTIRAQIYRAPQGSVVFTATNAFVDLVPPIPGPIAIGAIATGNASFAPVPVSVGDRLLMVFSAATSTAVAATILGNAAAGITIE
ncbi:exosporium glycoprotein BclB-related protein [Sporosarcina sp. YIM B06819]|uniref:exosporium glycoprotein BclB-related protein n=1 Tax=Sporosarcina sp. YIM B06819 TaxID=3081769 RepID=UPI00298CB030|nr:exosporium glycoprotein BclB-related protein [Sporosarcina sp. YIM B06819]